MSCYEDVNVEVTDGLTVYARDYRAGDDLMPVVCIPGFTRNSAEFDEVARRIVARGRRVVSIDPRGRGRSSWDPRPERYVYESYAGDALAVLDALAIPKAVFLGQSMGGRVALFVHRAAPERVGAIIFNDCGPTPPASGLDRVADYLNYVSRRFASWDDLADELGRANAHVYPGRGRDFFLSQARQVGRQYEDGIGFHVDPRIAGNFNELLRPGGKIVDFTGMMRLLGPIPLLLLHGVLSDILPAETVAGLAELDLRLTVAEVPGVGHCPTLDEPAAWEAIAAFLDRMS
jgi:pimeloyl-ACP methyl ester carboxylesterase